MRLKLSAQTYELWLDRIVIASVLLGVLFSVLKVNGRIWSGCIIWLLVISYLILYIGYRKTSEKRDGWLTFMFWLYVVTISASLLLTLIF